MAYDGTNNPTPPVYSQAKPGHKSCVDGDPNMNFYVPSVGGKTTLVLAGEQIRVDDLSNSEQDIFRVHYDPVEQLTVILTTIARINDVQQQLPILSGEEVDEVNLTWEYSQPIVTQGLINNGGLSQPILGPLDLSKDYVDISITSNTKFTISGDTGEGIVPESTASDDDTITFGNYLIWGKGASLNGKPLADAQTYATAFIGLDQTKIKTSRQDTITALGGAGEKFFLMWPKDWGLASFQVDGIPQNMFRVKNVGGTLKHTLAGGESETDISIDNQSTNNFTEAYYIYESFFDNIGGLNIQIL